MDIDIEVVFGACLIVIYATERFNTPATIRASTTAGRYYASALVYLLIYLATFFIFTRYPQLVAFLNVDMAEVEASGIDPGESTVILVALLLSLLLPKVPVISDVDQRLRRFLHRLAAIPYEAIRLSKEIQHSRYEIPFVNREVLARELEDHGFPPRAMETRDPVICRWVEIVSLMTQLKAWDRTHRWAMFVQERSGQLERIKEHYARVGRMAVNAVALKAQAEAQPELESLQDAAQKFRSNLQSSQQALLAEICDFISHGVLKTCLRYGSRQNTLMQMGFLDVAKDTGMGLSVNQTVMLFGLLLMLVLSNFILFRPPDAGGERLLLMIAMIVAIYAAAVICAVVPKQRWKLFQYQGEHFYPAAGYLISGLLAVVISAGISLFFKTLVFAASPNVDGFIAPFASAWDQFTSDSYPWLTMSFATAVSTAFMIDWRRPDWLSRPMHRLAAGLFQAAFLMAAAALVHWWLSSLSVAGEFGGNVPELASVLRLSGIVGFTLGLVVPTWYRTTSANGDRADAAGNEVSEAQTAEGAVLDSPVVKPLRGAS